MTPSKISFAIVSSNVYNSFTVNPFILYVPLLMENAGQLIEDEDLRAQIKGSVREEILFSHLRYNPYLLIDRRRIEDTEETSDDRLVYPRR